MRELMAVGEERRGSSDERARGRRRWEGRRERRGRKARKKGKERAREIRGLSDGRKTKIRRKMQKKERR